MNVEMPDGTIVTDVPDGTTQSDIQARYAARPQGGLADQAPAHNDPVADRWVDSNPVGRVLDAFGQGFKNQFGSQPILSPETEAAIQAAKLDKSPLGTLRRSFNEAIFRPAATMLSGGMRMMGAVPGATGRMVGQILDEVGAEHVNNALKNVAGLAPSGTDHTADEFEFMGSQLPMALGVATDFGVLQKTAQYAADQKQAMAFDNIGEAQPPAEFAFSDFPDNPPPRGGLDAGEHPNPFVVARKLPDGSIRYGQPGDLHADLYYDGWTKGAPGYAGDIPNGEHDLYNGFAVAEGAPFMSREEALAELNRRNAATAPPVRTMAADEGIPKPHTLFSEPTAVDKAGNINLDYIGAPEDVKDVIRQTAQANGGFTDARRGTISLPQTEDLADALGMSPETLDGRKVGQAFNAEEVTAARKLLVQSATNVRDLAKRAASGSETDLQAFVQAEIKHKMIQEHVAGLTAEAGRALNAFKIDARAAGEAKDFTQVLADLGDSPEGAAARARVIDTLDTPEKVSRFIMDSRKPTFKDQFLEYWINGLLSGPATHTTYTESNALFAMWKAGVETPVAGAIGKVREFFNPAAAEDRVFMGETGARMHGFVQGAKEGIVGGWNAFKNGVPDALPGEDQIFSKPHAIPGLAGDVLRVPSRVIAGIHGFYRAVGYRMSLNALAYRDIASQGLEGEDFATALAALKDDPPEEMMAAARQEAAENAMMVRPDGAFGKRLEAFANTNVATKMVMPFVRVGMNIVDQGLVQRTPLGLLSPSVRQALMGELGDAARDTQIARMGVGTALGAAVVGLTAEGYVTGGGPSDPHQRAALALTGWQPYSLKIGDTYYGYHRMGSLGQIVGVAADMFEIGHAMSDEDATGLATMVVNSIAKNMIDETWMRGPAELIQAIQDPDRYGGRYVNNQLATLIPFSVGMNQMARAIDPDLRNAQTLLDTIKSRIPFVSETVRPRFDLWGQPIPNQGSLGPDALSAIYTSRVNMDPVNQELGRLGLAPALPDKKIRGVRLTDDLYDEYQMTSGRLAKAQLDQLVASPGWMSVPDFAQKELFQNTIRNSRQAAAGLMQMRHPDLITQGVQARIKQIRGVAK